MDTSYNFGEMLRSLRQRKGVTQQQLARQLGLHRNTIGGWERGDYLPENKGMVLEIAKCLRLDAQETRQLLEASLTALAPHWDLPTFRNPFFTGREEILALLHAGLGADQTLAGARSYALYGMGGIGKTQVAVEYAYRHMMEYSAIFWITAESAERIMASYLRIAELLKLPEWQETDQQRTVAGLQRWLTTHSRWLLIWDNLEDINLLPRFLPVAYQGALLITTRCQALGTLARHIELPPMRSEEGALLLLRRAKLLQPAGLAREIDQSPASLRAEYPIAQKLVAAMDGLPLALDQAGAYIEETGCSLSDYLQRYQDRRAQLLARRGNPGKDHPQSVTATFLLAIQRLKQEHPEAANLLLVCAFLHTEAIPEEIFVEGAASLTLFHPLATDAYQLDLAIAALRTFSLVQRQSETRTFSIHRIVQAVLLGEMSEQERALRQPAVLCMLNSLFPEATHRSEWERCKRLLPHVLAVAAIPDQAGGQTLAEVLRKAADYLRQRVQYAQAEPLYKRALRISEEGLGPEHPEVMKLLNLLAELFYLQEKYAQAEEVFLRILRIREQLSGLEHPQIADALNGLANIYAVQGKYAQAEALYQQSLRIWQRTLGPDHPETAYALGGLAELYKDLGKYRQAVPFYQQALRIREQAFGPDHPQVAYTLRRLANLYRGLGQYEQSEILDQQSLRIGEQTLGADHPLIAHSLHGLARLCALRGEYEQAEALYLQALGILEQAAGSDNADYLLDNLATTYRIQGKYEQAETLYLRALCIRERMYGPEHPALACSWNHLATLSFYQGKSEQAEALYLRALRIREQWLGPEHPDVAFTLQGLANLYSRQSQEKAEKARILFQRALAICERRLGLEHPETALVLADFAALHMQCGRHTEAYALFQRALALQEQHLGSRHPTTRQTRAHFTKLVALLQHSDDFNRVSLPRDRQ